MTFEDDRRIHAREKFNALVLCSYLSKNASMDARTLNHCDGGMCLVSKTQCQCGAIVYIRATEYCQDCRFQENCPLLRSASLAEIKWCNAFYENGNKLFAIGAKYLPSYY